MQEQLIVELYSGPAHFHGPLKSPLSPPPGRSTPDDVKTPTLDFQIPRITAESVEDNRGSSRSSRSTVASATPSATQPRRVLLASLAGAAVTSVRIEGVAHEFSTIKGVTEAVTDIVLNLKGIVCRMRLGRHRDRGAAGRDRPR